MARGRQAKEGDTNVSANGYHYTRTKEAWVLTHRLLAEQALGRSLASDEYASFDNGDRTDLAPGNIVVKKRRGKSTAQRRARLESRIADLQAELEELDA
jgi:hypothetical protein